MNILLKWFLNSIIILALPFILKGIYVENFITAIVVALVIGLLNTLLRPILIIFTLPITILTLGLFVLVINGLILFIASKLIPGFYISNIWYAILIAMTLSIFNSIIK